MIPQCIAAAKFLVASPHPSLYQPCWKFGVFCCLRTAYLVVKLPLGETEIFLMTMSLTLPTWKSAPCFAGTIDSNILPGKDHGLSHGLVTLSLTVAFCQVWVFWVWFWFGFFFRHGRLSSICFGALGLGRKKKGNTALHYLNIFCKLY